MKSSRPASAEQRPLSPPSRSSASSAASPRPRRPTTDQILYAQPASLHFGGFELQRTMQQRVRVHNNSAKSVRFRYTFPTGRKGFRAAFASAERPSFVSAGLSEEIAVSFTPPADFQYYYDCIQVRCEEVAYGSSTDVVRSGSVLIPLHAYPMVNEVSFPTRMDFGVVPRGSCARRQVAITCSVPVEFEYELQITKPHPAFTVFPLSGSIPPRGEARIELEYRPTLYATANAEMELHVSQLGFVPRICMLAGSSSSTAGDAAVDTAEQKRRSPAPPSSEGKSGSQSESQKKTSEASTPRSSANTRSRKTPAEEGPQVDDDHEEEELEKVRGVEIPRALNSVTSVSYVLNQKSGKLKPKDLKKAIAANRALRQQQREEQEKLSSGSGGGDEAVDASTLSFRVLVREEEGYLQRVQVNNQVKDMFFQQELREVAQAEKTLEFQSHKVHLGQRLLSSDQITYLTRLRHSNALALARQQREQLRTTFTNIRYYPPLTSDITSNDEQPLLLGELKTAVLPAHFVPAYTPDFKLYKNNMWARRQRILRRLVRGVSTCILRLRAQKRLKRIHEWLEGANTRAQVREKVVLDWQRTGHARVDENSDNTKQSLSKQNFDAESKHRQRQHYLSSFPLVKENTAQKSREIIDLPPDWELKFNSFTFMELKPRDEALLMGHEALPLPALPTYLPLELDRELRQGAAGECGVVMSLILPTTSGSTPESGCNSMPSLLDLMPADVFLRPQASIRPLVEVQTPRETEPSYVLHPRRVFRSPPLTMLAWEDEQIGLQSITSSQGGGSLRLSDVFIASMDRRQVDPLFPPLQTPERDGGGVWNVATAAIPTLAERPEDVPSLSDSESDDDAESGLNSASSSLSATWKNAVTLFEDVSLEQERDSIYENGELLGQAKGVYSFERYRHLIQQERTYNAWRRELLDRLPKQLEEVASQIKNADYALVVQGHGPERPLHGCKQAEA